MGKPENASVQDAGFVAERCVALTDPPAELYVVAEDPEYHPLDHWEIDGENVGSANPLTVTMDRDKCVWAVFNPVCSVSVPQASHSDTVSFGTLFSPGDELPAAPAGQVFSHWTSRNELEFSTDRNAAVHLWGSRTFEAAFVATPPTCQASISFLYLYDADKNKLNSLDVSPGGGATETGHTIDDTLPLRGETYTVGGPLNSWVDVKYTGPFDYFDSNGYRLYPPADGDSHSVRLYLRPAASQSLFVWGGLNDLAPPTWRLAVQVAGGNPGDVRLLAGQYVSAPTLLGMAMPDSGQLDVMRRVDSGSVTIEAQATRPGVVISGATLDGANIAFSGQIKIASEGKTSRVLLINVTVYYNLVVDVYGGGYVGSPKGTTSGHQVWQFSNTEPREPALTEVPDPGSRFVGWFTGDASPDQPVSTKEEYQLPVLTGHLGVAALFEKVPNSGALSQICVRTPLQRKSFAPHFNNFYNVENLNANDSQGCPVFFNDVHDPDSQDPLAVRPFDIELRALGAQCDFDPNQGHWTKPLGPASGEFADDQGTDALFQNPTKGGVYRLEYDYGTPEMEMSNVNVVLPLAGAEIKDIVKSDLALAEEFGRQIPIIYPNHEFNPLDYQRWFKNADMGDYHGLPQGIKTEESRPDELLNERYSVVSPLEYNAAGHRAIFDTVATWFGYPIDTAMLNYFLVGHALKAADVSTLEASIVLLGADLLSRKAAKRQIFWDGYYIETGNYDSAGPEIAMTAYLAAPRDSTVNPATRTLWPNNAQAVNHVDYGTTDYMVNHWFGSPLFLNTSP